MFEREVSKEIAVIYHKGLLEDNSLESLRRTNMLYFEKYLRYSGFRKPNVFGVHCDGCEPRMKSEWVHSKQIPNTDSCYYGTYADENLLDGNFVCFSRCGNPKFENCKQDGRIDIRLLKINELYKYTTVRDTELIKLDQDNLMFVDSRNKELYQRLFDILIPISEQQQKSKKQIPIEVLA